MVSAAVERRLLRPPRSLLLFRSADNALRSRQPQPFVDPNQNRNLLSDRAKKDRQPNETQIRIDLHEFAFVFGEDRIPLKCMWTWKK